MLFQTSAPRADAARKIGSGMAQVSYSAGNAVIDLGNGDSITLNGVASGLDTSDFAIPNVAPFADIALGSYTATEQTALNLKGAAGNAVFLVGDSDSPFAIMRRTLWGETSRR